MIRQYKQSQQSLSFAAKRLLTVFLRQNQNQIDIFHNGTFYEFNISNRDYLSVNRLITFATTWLGLQQSVATLLHFFKRFLG